MSDAKIARPRTVLLMSFAIVALLGVIGGIALSGAWSNSPNGTRSSRSDAPTLVPADVQSLLLKGLSDRLASWITKPGCQKPSITLTPADFENDGVALKDGLTNAWNVLKSYCTVGDPAGWGTYQTILYALPHGTIVRDSNTADSWMLGFNGEGGLWPIPTGGDYLCFTGQGHPVYELPGLASVFPDNWGFGLAKCTPDAPHVSVAPVAPPVTVVTSVIAAPPPVVVTKSVQVPPKNPPTTPAPPPVTSTTPAQAPPPPPPPPPQSPAITISWGGNPAPYGYWMNLTFSNFPTGPVSWYCVEEGVSYGPYSTTLSSSTETFTAHTCFDTQPGGSDYVTADGVNSNTIPTD